jgi:DNA polymerase I-like protein with 3'-5' exonuclease and polymerase domains
MATNNHVANRILSGCKVAIVTDTPTAQDVVKQELLTDKPAQILLGKLAACGIDYTSASLLSVVQTRHTTVEYISQPELTAWIALLERDLQKAQPNVIVAVGEIALRSLTYHNNVEKYRGTPCECKLALDAVVIPLEHFSQFFGSPAWQPLTDFYAQKIARYQHSNKSPVLDVETVVTHDIELLEREFLSEEFLNDPNSKIGFDIESSLAEMTCIGFAKSPTLAYVIPLVKLPMDKFVPCIRVIDRILRSKVRKIAQNGNFDLTYLGYHYHIKVENFWWDTMLAQHSCFPNLPKDLGTVSSICTNQAYWKDDGKVWAMPYDQINWKQFFEYNGKDCANLLTIQETQEQLIALRDTQSTFDREMALCKPLIAMELDGIAINQPKVAELKAETGDLIRRWQLFLDTLLGDELKINIASPAQLAELLYNQLKLPKRVRAGKITTDEHALSSLLTINPIVIKPVMMLKKLKKEFSEYKVKLNEDGRMRATFKPAGTMTGRLASSKSILDSGTNFQNRTKKIRVYFEPDNTETQLLVNIDYSKAESWIVAALAEDDKMLAALYGPDFHSENASNILGKTVTKKNYSDYQLGKRISHGCVDGDTEVLTPDGWVKFKHLDNDTQVMQWEEDKTLSFVTPSHVTRTHYTGEMIHLKGISCNLLMTPNHRVGFYTYDNKLRIEEARKFVTRRCGKLPQTGTYSGAETYDLDFLRLCIATLADGSIDNSGGIRFRFRKQRKVDRLLSILPDSGWSYNYHESDNTHNFYLGKVEAKQIVDLITKQKVLGSWILQLTQECLQCMKEEIVYWDGWTDKKSNQKEFVSTKLNNVDWMQTVCFLCDSQALLRVDYNRHGNRKDLYTLSINSRTRADYSSMTTRYHQHDDMVYCVTVPSGMFMVRKNGKIMITGNSNYRMTAFLLQKVLAKDGYIYTKTEAGDLMEAYHNSYPNIRNVFHRRIEEQVKMDRTLTNAYGRKVTFWDHWSPQLLNSATAWLPQGTVGDLTNTGLINIYNRIPEARLRIQVHDSVVLQINKADISQDLIDRLSACMLQELTINGITFTIPIDIELGSNWLDLKDWEDVKHDYATN